MFFNLLYINILNYLARILNYLFKIKKEMIRKTLITTMIAIAITTMVSGQETWDLERCMLYALENTPDIKKEDC